MPADNPGAPECRFLIDLAEAWNPLPSGGEGWGGGKGGGQQLHTVMQGDKQVGAAAEVAPWWEEWGGSVRKTWRGVAGEGADRKQEVGSSDSLLFKSLRSMLLFPFHCLPSAGAVLEHHCELLL